jgi:Zn-dependent protease
MSSAPPPYGPQRPPPDEPSGYVPFRQYYEPAPEPAPERRGRAAQRGGLIGTLLAAGAVLLKFGSVKTLLTLLLSFGAYSWIRGPWFAAGLVLMILVHEMGHVVEIRRQGMQASAPLFIPFVGAAIFQRQHPTDALRQAQIGIAGPIAGTIGATVAFVLYGATGWPELLRWAWLGFFLNLFNLIPFGFLDGGWIMAAVSKWFQFVGLALFAGALLLFGLNPILLVVLMLGIPTATERFRNDSLPYFQSVPMAGRLAMAAAWLVLAGYLGVALLQVSALLGPQVR